MLTPPFAQVDHFMGAVARAYPGGLDTFTRYLHVDFREPFSIPGPTLCRAWIKKIEGRKFWLQGRMEDEDGNAYITAEGLFLKGGPKL